MKDLEWISPPQKDDTGDYILKEEVEKAVTRMKNKRVLESMKLQAR